jgi:hypothetical protein
VGKGEYEMGYSLEKLNNILFDQLERLSNNDLRGDRLEEELKRTDQLVKVSGQIINSGNLQLNAMKHADEYGYSMSRHMPELLEVRENAAKNTKGNR